MISPSSTALSAAMHPAIVAHRSGKDLNAFRLRDTKRTAPFSMCARARNQSLFQQENPISVVKWLRQAGQRHGGKLRKRHSGFILTDRTRHLLTLEFAA